MSPNIWTACAASSDPSTWIKRLTVEPFRVVESQSITSTRKLVDSDDEQQLLEEMIDAAKPPRPVGGAFAGLHYLLYTSFRHPPLRNGSRFGTRAERGIWYGALSLRTAFAEVAYYRLVFLEGTRAPLGAITVELSSFRAHVGTRRGVDLTRPPFDAHLARISSKTRYEPAQRLGAELRGQGIDAFVYRSARDVLGGNNVGLFEPVFTRKVPHGVESWVCTVDRSKVEVRRKDFFRRMALVFPRADFEVRGALPSPAIG
ncbi:MAG: RES family NAD+ phosphorylase [Polyangiales bacterium]